MDERFDRLVALARSQAESIADWDLDRAVGYLLEVYRRDYPFSPLVSVADVQVAHDLAQGERTVVKGKTSRKKGEDPKGW